MKLHPAVLLLLQCDIVGAHILATASLAQWGKVQEQVAAPAPAPAAAKTLPGVLISFALNNIDYDDMEKKVPISDGLTSAPRGEPYTMKSQQRIKSSPAFLTRTTNRTKAQLFDMDVRSDVGQAVTVQDMLRCAITDAVTQAIRPYWHTASQWAPPANMAAPASAPKALLQFAQAPPAPAVVQAPPAPAQEPSYTVFVQFSPGEEILVKPETPSFRDLEAAMRSGDVIATMPHSVLKYPLRSGDLNATFTHSDGFEDGDVVEIRHAGKYENKQINTKGDKNQIYFSEPMLNSYACGSTVRVVAKAHSPVGRSPVDHDSRVHGKMILRHSNPTKPVNVLGTTTKVAVTVIGMSRTAVDEVPVIKRAVETSEAKGYLQAALKRKIFETSSVMPNMTVLRNEITQIEQWDVHSCAKHLNKVVVRFGRSYTMRNVPWAIYNECTNFAPAMSFSHDPIPTQRDVHACKDATVKFAAKWNAPKKGKHGLNGSEMVDFCVDVCEHKYGAAMQMCHVVEGEKLKDDPL